MIRSDKNIDRLRLSLLGKSIHPVQTVQLPQLRWFPRLLSIVTGIEMTEAQSRLE